MTITAIGFANKFYTLWNINEEIQSLGNGHSYIVTHYTFIKNISFDKEVALSKYPEAILDENLRGKTLSWETKKEVWDNVDTFRFGKYNGKKINETDDINYIAWYWEQIYGDHKEFVGNFLKKHGYEIRKWSGDVISGEYLMSPEDLVNEKEHLDIIMNMYNKCVTNEILEVTFNRNLDEYGTFRDGDIIYEFENFKLMYYQGYKYGLPIDSKGKSKRIKNKTLKLTDYTYSLNDHNVLTIVIKNFEIA